MIRNRSSILMKQVFSIFRNRPRYLLIRYVLITNGKSSIFTGEKPGRYHPNPGTKLNRHPDILFPFHEPPRRAEHHC